MERDQPFWNTKRSWKSSIEIDLKGTEREDTDWFQMARDRFQVAGYFKHVN